MKPTNTLIRFKTMVNEIVSAVLVFLFVYAATSKIIDHDTFRYTLQYSPLLAYYSNVVSWAIPIIEIIISVLLIFPKFRVLGLLYSGCLLCLFILYIACMLVFNQNLPCSCGGIIKDMSWKEHLVFNICFAGLAFFSWISIKTNKEFIAINRLEAENPEKMM